MQRTAQLSLEEGLAQLLKRQERSQQRQSEYPIRFNPKAARKRFWRPAYAYLDARQEAGLFDLFDELVRNLGILEKLPENVVVNSPLEGLPSQQSS
jgi:hypothetical protein